MMDNPPVLSDESELLCELSSLECEAGRQLGALLIYQQLKDATNLVDELRELN